MELIQNEMAPELPRLVAEESKSSASYRHTRGQVLTFPRGLKWFVHTDVVQPFHYEFLGISVFVMARFSSGVSAMSSRHPAWPAMAQVTVFDVKRLEHDHPMWVYVRHDQAGTLWQIRPSSRRYRQPIEELPDCLEILLAFRPCMQNLASISQKSRLGGPGSATCRQSMPDS